MPVNAINGSLFDASSTHNICTINEISFHVRLSCNLRFSHYFDEPKISSSSHPSRCMCGIPE